MRSRMLLGAGALIALTIPAAALAQGVTFPFFGPILPEAIRSCPASFAAVIDIANRIIAFAISITILFIAPLMIAYAGFLYVVNPVNPSGRSKAKGMLQSLVIGVVIALAGWLIVDAVFAVLYNPNAKGFNARWYEIITGTGELCIKQAGALRQVVTPTPTTVTGVPTVGKAKEPCAPGNTACSTAAIAAAASNLGIPMSNEQVTAMSCIAMTESSGNPNTPNSSTGACGTFQITTRPGNWSIASFHQSPCSTTSSCNDAACNLQTALLLYKQRGFQPWTGKDKQGQYWNPNAVACVQKYNPGATNI